MSWNHSTRNGVPITKNKGSSTLRGVLAGIIVFAVVMLGICYAFVRMVSREPETQNDNIANVRQISQVEHVIVSTSRVESVLNTEEDHETLEWLKKHDKRYRIPPDAVRAPNGRLYTKGGVRILESLPARKIDPTEGQKRVFVHYAEREIARLLTLQPGQVFVSTSTIGPLFIESFKKSLSEPTLLLKDDSDDERELKKQVNEVKAELRERMESGEDIVAILKSAEEELFRLSSYRENLQKEIVALRFDETVTEKDYSDYVDAANKMLKERGLPGLSSRKFAEAQLKVMRQSYKSRMEDKSKDQER